MESFAEPMNIEIINCWVITLQISECGINYGTSKCNDFSNTLIQLRFNISWKTCRVDSAYFNHQAVP